MGKGTISEIIMDDPGKLSEIFDYNPETGKLFWRRRPEESFATRQASSTWNTRFAGKEAFTSVDGKGYRHGTLCGKSLLAHRVILAMANGRWPEQVDHINGDRSDNRIKNIREATHQENSRNRRMLKSNTSGIKGVCWSKAAQKWQANIKVNGKQFFLGVFDSLEDAAESVKAKRIEMHGQFSNHE